MDPEAKLLCGDGRLHHGDTESICSTGCRRIRSTALRWLAPSRFVRDVSHDVEQNKPKRCVGNVRGAASMIMEEKIPTARFQTKAVKEIVVLPFITNLDIDN